MSIEIPKIVYGAGNTEIAFDYPPAFSGDGPEEYDVIDNTTLSLSGVRQTSLNRIEALQILSFEFASETTLSDFQTFITTHAALGKSFKYYRDRDSTDYVSYELTPGFKWKPSRIAGVGANVFIYKLPITFRRVIGEASTDMITATIANNQSSAAVVTGVVFDHTLYKTVKIFCEINRKTDSLEVVANGYLTAIYKVGSSTWDVTATGNFDGDAHGCTFSMSAEQLKYTSDNQAGTNYVGVIKVKEMVFA